jgi:D-hydroxyproline dehydrogenase subunit alpha
VTLGIKCDTAIVGAGCAGVVAAHILADHGLDILVMDENPHTGGQALRSLPWPQNPSIFTGLNRPGIRRLPGRIKTAPVPIMHRTQVIGIDGHLEILAEKNGKEIICITPQAVLLATGARETFVPFPGWALPGVISTGAAQILMKGSGILPADNMVAAGLGPFLTAVSAEYLSNRGRLLSIADFGKMQGKLGMLIHGFHQFSKLLEGTRYLAKILGSKVPFHHQTMVLEATGTKELERVVLARVDNQGKIIAGTGKIYTTGCLAIGWGFAPNLELPLQAGCAILHDPELGGWVTAVNDAFESSIPGIFCAGEITGIAGASKSIIEGELAARGILEKLGREVDENRMAVLQRQRKHVLAFGAYFNRLHRVPDTVFCAIPDTVTICRCENITMGDIKTAVKKGYDTPALLKKALRCGMGFCQGRTCGPVINRILAAVTNRPAGDIPMLPVRMPVKPVSVRSFLQ